MIYFFIFLCKRGGIKEKMQDEAQLTKHSYALRYIIEQQQQEQQKSNKGRRNGKEVDRH